MDKFVIRIPKEKKKPKNDNGIKVYKQAKIENLKGVVVIEDLERAKVILERSDTSTELKVDTLQSLLKKAPCKEILIKTKIGKTVHKLCRHSDQDVSSAAKKVYESWRSYVVKSADKPSIEVQYDLHTRQFREKARRLILNALKDNASAADKSAKSEGREIDFASTSETKNLSCKPGPSEDTHNLEELAEYIEREVFKVSKNRTTNSYRKTNRKIVFALKYKNDIKLKLIASEISVQQLVKMFFE